MCAQTLNNTACLVEDVEARDDEDVDEPDEKHKEGGDDEAHDKGWPVAHRQQDCVVWGVMLL